MPEWVEILLRSLVLILTLFFFTKMIRQKHLSQLNVFHYMNGIVAGGIVAITTTNTGSLLNGLIALAVWFVVPLIIDYLSLKSKTIRDFVDGKSTVIIQGGKIMEENLKKTAFTAEDLLQHLRRKNVFHVADVEFALLEPTGELTVLPKADKLPVTPADLNMKKWRSKEAQTVIMDGKLLLEPLANLNLQPRWLYNELEKRNVTVENVFLGQADRYGQLTIDLYDDQLPVFEPTEMPLLLATLKKAHADLALFALATENEESKQLYEQNSAKVQQVINLLEPYLQA